MDEVAFANLARLARGKSKSVEEIFSQKRKDAKVRSDAGMGLIPKLCALAGETLELVSADKLQARI